MVVRNLHPKRVDSFVEADSVQVWFSISKTFVAKEYIKANQSNLTHPSTALETLGNVRWWFRKTTLAMAILKLDRKPRSNFLLRAKLHPQHEPKSLFAPKQKELGCFSRPLGGSLSL